MHEKPILPNKPTRIISLVPSQTELLFDLGLREEVIGITKFCIHPNEWFRTKTRVGGTKNLNLDRIHELKPDLILANKEENSKEQILELQKHYPVYISDIETIDDALEMIGDIGELVHRVSDAKNIIQLINQERKAFHQLERKRNCLYLIWYKPFMAAGIDTFINNMMKEGGFENCLDSSRYPELSIQEIKELNPSIIFLSSEPFPFKQVHIDELQEICPNATIKLVDGELFSWYGSRMSQSFKYFRALNEEIK